MKKQWWRLSIVMALMMGGVFLWQYSGADSASVAQIEINEKGWHYLGETTLSNDAYYALKNDLSLRNFSIQTGSDLVIKTINNDGSVAVSYSFFSIEDYPQLNRQKPEGAFGVGFSLMPSLVPLLYFAIIIIYSFKILEPLLNNRKDINSEPRKE